MKDEGLRRSISKLRDNVVKMLVLKHMETGFGSDFVGFATWVAASTRSQMRVPYADAEIEGSNAHLRCLHRVTHRKDNQETSILAIK